MTADDGQADELTSQHHDVLETVVADHPIEVGTLADETMYPLYKVRYSLQELEATGLINRTATGLVPTDEGDQYVLARREQRDEERENPETAGEVPASVK